MDKIITWGDIYNEFVSKCGEKIKNQIDDYRPAVAAYLDIPTDIPMAIIVWLKDGTKIIYQTKVK